MAVGIRGGEDREWKCPVVGYCQRKVPAVAETRGVLERNRGAKGTRGSGGSAMEESCS